MLTCSDISATLVSRWRAQEQEPPFHDEGTRVAGIAAAEIAGLNAEPLRGADRLAAKINNRAARIPGGADR